jgi:predicted TIM-barrel fold metal-dependent hydrolase
MRCDSHVHVVGPADIYLQSPTRTYLAEAAPLDKLRALATARQIDRFVIVQPSFYGADNTVLLESLDALGGRGRGVAVVDPATITKATLDEYAARGVVATLMAWHVEVIAPIEALVQEAELLAKAAVPVVIDHYGVFGRNAPADTACRQLLGLLSYPHVWMKLSAPYRVSDDPLDTKPNPDWLAAILGVARERCVWGSDWPHTPAHDAQKGATIATSHRPISYERLVDDFIAALASVELTETIMRDNPARLYEF